MLTVSHFTYEEMMAQRSGTVTPALEGWAENKSE